MNDEPIRADPDRAALVAQVAERIRIHPDPAMRARAVQIAIASEDLQAIDRWTDPRGLARRGELALTPEAAGVRTTPADALAGIGEALASLRSALDAAEVHRDAAKQHAARLYISR